MHEISLTVLFFLLVSDISPEARQLSKNAIASISVACGIVLVVGVVCLFVLIRRRRNAHTESKSDSG